MHIKKNFHDNIMGTILHVRDKTKDNLKSRLDLPLYCSRRELHITDDGKSPFPLFRLSAMGRRTFLESLAANVKFPDGYSSNLANCVDF